MVKIRNKSNNKSFIPAAVWSIAAGMILQIIGALVCTNLLINGNIREGDMAGIAVGVRCIAILLSAILSWIISGDDKLMPMIISCGGMVLVWFITALGLAGIQIQSHLINIIICIGVYGAVYLLFPQFQNTNKNLKFKKKYR